MHSTTHDFRKNARAALIEEGLQTVLGGILHHLPEKRRKAIEGLPEFDALRDAAKEIKDHTLNNLDFYLEQFEERVVEAGGQVHWCETHADAREKILQICRSVDAKSVTKGKSMISEEIGVNKHLEEHGITPIETDMGEYIIQLADEPPSHLIGPAFHKSKEEVSDLFFEHHKTERWTDGEDLMAEGRKVLRKKYFEADVGITGANFLIAETGTSVIVTNEGNGDLTQILPKVHIVCASLEKLVPTLEDTSTLLRLLSRSATGQDITAYTTFSTGPKREKDPDGPEQFHVVLLDAGRSKYLGTEVQDVLRCIRCSACLNHCPVYMAVGGHAYGWVYPGPIGAALDPILLGSKEARHLPASSSLCGRCEVVCPVRIPIPKILRHWRNVSFKNGDIEAKETIGLKIWKQLAIRPRLYRLTMGLGVKALSMLGRGKRVVRRLPMSGGWANSRDLPLPEGETFMSQWKKHTDGQEPRP